MRKLGMMVMTAAMCAAVIGMAPAPAASLCTMPTDLPFRSCGDHVRLSKLPLHFSYNPAGAPASVRSHVEAVITASMSQWNNAWPLKKPGCGAVFCYDGQSTRVPDDTDGRSVILFGDPGSCDGVSDAVAVACMEYEGTSVAKRQDIEAVDIILNAGDAWAHVTEPVDLLAATIAGDTNPSFSDAWYDVQSTLTHELGHAIGLDDIGSARPWPAFLEDALTYMETMYAWHYPGTANKRTLHAGDLAGVHYQAFLSANDM